MSETPGYVWAVQFGNYSPPEVIAIYDNEAAAQAHAEWENEGSNDAWRAVQWELWTEFDRDDEGAA